MIQMKELNCIIIHGCPSNKEKALNPETRTYDKHWIPWTKKELNSLNIKTETPLMPSPWEPVYKEFKKEFEKYHINENSILIWHSCWCSFLVRWLWETQRYIHKLVLVAPWKIKKSASKFEKEFYEFPIDKNIKDRVNEIIIFTANNEAQDGKKWVEMFHKAIGGNIINLENHWHYCLRDMWTEEFPELITSILI